MSNGFRLIVGLGNPGRPYEGTRHNVGFMVVDRISKQADAPFRDEPKWGCAVAKWGPAMLCKPMRFMNCSGGPVRTVADFFKIPPGEMLVALDDSALPLGRLRLRAQGSAGGHHGLESILEAFGTDEVPRVRIGIGGASGIGMVDHVLGRFTAEEEPARDSAVTRAADAIKLACEEGLTAAMNEFNKTEET